MIRSFLERQWDNVALVFLAAVIVLAGGFVVAVVIPDAQRAMTAEQASASAAPSPSSPAEGSRDVMTWLGMSADSDCAGCHVTEGGTVGLRPVPPIAHPLKGWTNCTACHASERLVDTAPGHTGIHAEDCLTCHQPGDLPAPLTRPHGELQNGDCLGCHGSSAPLPTDMAHRSESVCWLCHRLPEEEPPTPAHRVLSDQADCLSCHVAGKVGELPLDHANREQSECLLCHATPGDASGAGSLPVSLSFRLRPG
jgi:hypothetical protein